MKKIDLGRDMRESTLGMKVTANLQARPVLQVSINARRAIRTIFLSICMISMSVYTDFRFGLSKGARGALIDQQCLEAGEDILAGQLIAFAGGSAAGATRNGVRTDMKGRDKWGINV